MPSSAVANLREGQGSSGEDFGEARCRQKQEG